MSMFRCLSIHWLVASAIAFAATAVAAAERAAPWVASGPASAVFAAAPAPTRWCHRDGDRLIVVDLDGNGREDQTCQSANGDVRVLLASLAAGGANEGAVWRRRWCPSAEARLVWVDVDRDGRADAVCLRGNGNHAALRSADGALQAAGEHSDGRLIDGWCPGATVPARVSMVHGDGRLGLRCTGVDGEIRLRTWFMPELDASYSSTAPIAAMVAFEVEPERPRVVQALLGIPLLLLALGAIPVLHRRPSGLRSGLVVLLLVFAAAYPERVAQTAGEKPSELSLLLANELQSGRPDATRTRSSPSCENAITLRDR